MGRPALSNYARSAPSIQQKFDLFNKALIGCNPHTRLLFYDINDSIKHYPGWLG
jgi:hypothetical protein